MSCQYNMMSNYTKNTLIIKSLSVMGEIEFSIPPLHLFIVNHPDTKKDGSLFSNKTFTRGRVTG